MESYTFIINVKLQCHYQRLTKVEDEGVCLCVCVSHRSHRQYLKTVGFTDQWKLGKFYNHVPIIVSISRTTKVKSLIQTVVVDDE